MSNAQVYELCKKCNTPTKARVDFLGNVRIIDVKCECEKQAIEEKRKRQFRRKYYLEK